MACDVRVHLATNLVDPASLAGGLVVVIDLLRATTTMTAALHAGAANVYPVVEVEEAFEKRKALERAGAPPGSILLGGERGGRLIDGFDLDNSPRAYTPDRVGGRTVIFSTTNGTRAIHLARRAGAAGIVLACLGNLSRVAAHCAASATPVHILAAGHAGLPLVEDVLAAGAVAWGTWEALDRPEWSDDGARLAMAAWRDAVSKGEHGVAEAIGGGRHGRSLVRLGFGADIAWCARVDWTRVLPTLRGDGYIVPE